MKVQGFWLYCGFFFLNLTNPFLRILNCFHQLITSEKRDEWFDSVSICLSLSQRNVWSNALMCIGASTEPSSSAKTAADQFDWAHMAFIRAVIASFYPVDRTVISLTHIPTAQLGLALIWFGVCRHGRNNNRRHSDLLQPFRQTVTGLQSPGQLRYEGEAAQTVELPNTDATGRKKLSDCQWSYQTVWQLPWLCV